MRQDQVGCERRLVLLVLCHCPGGAKGCKGATRNAPTTQKLFGALCRGFFPEARQIAPAINIAAYGAWLIVTGWRTLNKRRRIPRS